VMSRTSLMVLRAIKFLKIEVSFSLKVSMMFLAEVHRLCSC
jgi:hypothetical protein